jgi:hypothetical protein
MLRSIRQNGYGSFPGSIGWTSASFVVGTVDKITQPLTTIKVDFINDYGGAIPKEFPISAGN